jgi:hypothetical protein
VTEAAVANQQQEATEEQCGCQAQELTLLSIRGSELCITVTGSLPRARHTEVASQFSVLRAAVSLAA